MKQWLQNSTPLDRSALRHDALAIIEEAYTSIDTETVLRSQFKLDGTILRVGDTTLDLSHHERVKIVGFGKVSCSAVQTIESILLGHVAEGIAIDVRPGVCEIAEIVEGTHPRPSKDNVDATSKIVTMTDALTEKDLVFVVVSGGGSSLLCWPQAECDQSFKLYDDFTRVGGSIEDLNIVRRHLSKVKGGGLAKLLQPATVVALVFCDVPGDRYDVVASGPTYPDTSTVADAEAILGRYALSGYVLNETPKDATIFKKVHNIPLVSNTLAFTGMSRKATELGYRVINAGLSRYDAPADMASDMLRSLDQKTVVIAGGEPKFGVNVRERTGGRCDYTALEALRRIGTADVFAAFASDGRDNSDSAGAIADALTLQKARELGLDIDAHLQRFNSHAFFAATDDLLMTGLTNANVSDMFLCLRR